MKRVMVLGLVMTAIGCAAGPRANGGGPRAPIVASATPTATPASFDTALAALVGHDEAKDWNEDACKEVGGLFDAIALATKSTAASYNAGLAYARCDDAAKARARYEDVLAKDPANPGARAELALDRYRRDKDASAAIASLESSVALAKFQSAPILVHLASMQMVRRADVGGQGCKTDMECAKLNLHRALAIDDAYMPAYRELALHYLRRAESASRRKGQELELAALLCSQAAKKDPSYAPIHNVAGLVESALGRPSRAASEFAEAARLDPRSFEAHMNLGALNLGFRGFSRAEEAYRKAVARKPTDYDAHLGLALALRGSIAEGPDYERRIAAVHAELDEAKKLDPNRPDAWFNEALLVHEYESNAKSSAESLAALGRARASFERFVDKAQGRSEYASSVTEARHRVTDIDKSIAFIGAPPSAP